MEQELELSAVIGFQGKFRSPASLRRQGHRGPHSPPRQRTHPVPPGNHHRCASHHFSHPAVPPRPRQRHFRYHCLKLRQVHRLWPAHPLRLPGNALLSLLTYNLLLPRSRAHAARAADAPSRPRLKLNQLRQRSANLKASDLLTSFRRTSSFGTSTLSRSCNASNCTRC